MGLLQTLKSILGIGGSDRSAYRETTVTVEREPEPEPDPGTERAVKEEPVSPTKEEAQEPEEPREPVDVIKGIGPAYAERLNDAGVATVSGLAEADAEDLAAVTDISETRLKTWIDRAKAR